MLKVKHERDCDCVVAGFRWHKGGQGTAIGSLLLGLYNDEGGSNTSASARASPMAKRRELVDFLAPYRENALEGHPWRAWAEWQSSDEAAPQRKPGGGSRWSQGKDLSWEPLRPGARRTGGVRSHAGEPLSTHGAVPAMANRQAPAGLHVRAARGRGAARAGGDLRDGTVAEPVAQNDTSLTRSPWLRGERGSMLMACANSFDGVFAGNANGKICYIELPASNVGNRPRSTRRLRLEHSHPWQRHVGIRRYHRPGERRIRRRAETLGRACILFYIMVDSVAESSKPWKRMAERSCSRWVATHLRSRARFRDRVATSLASIRNRRSR